MGASGRGWAPGGRRKGASRSLRPAARSAFSSLSNINTFSCRLPTRRIIKSLASPLIFKRKSPRPERPAQPGTSGLRVSPGGLRTKAREAGRRGKGAAPGDEELRVGGGGAKAPPHQCVAVAPGGEEGSAPQPPAPRGAQRQTGHQEPPATPERARSSGARQGGERSILPTAPRAPLARGRRAPAGTRFPRTARGRSCAPTSSLTPSPPAVAVPGARAARDGRATGAHRWPRAQPGGGAGLGARAGHPRGRGRSPGVHLRGPRAGRRRGPGAPAAAASCAGAKTPPSRGSLAEEAAVGAAAIRAGFYSGAATGGSPDPRDAGSGSSPWRGLPSPCPETTHPPPPPRCTQEAPPTDSASSPLRGIPSSPPAHPVPHRPLFGIKVAASQGA